MSVKTPDEIDIEVGQRIRAERLAKNVSQEKLANALGISFQQVQKYEKGVNRVGPSRLMKIAVFLGVPLAALYPDHTPVKAGDGSSASVATEVLTLPYAREVLDAYRVLCNQDRRLLADMARTLAGRQSEAA